MNDKPTTGSELLFYRTEDGRTRMEPFDVADAHAERTALEVG